jgi:hypothetical protein
MRFSHIFLFVSLTTILTSCASSGFLMAKPRVLMYIDAFPAKAPDAQIEIYRTHNPTRPYKELGEISCRDTDDEYALNQILIQARLIGADAIIILGSASTSSTGVPIAGMVYASSEEYGYRAVAIRYLE